MDLAWRYPDYLRRSSRIISSRMVRCAFLLNYSPTSAPKRLTTNEHERTQNVVGRLPRSLPALAHMGWPSMSLARPRLYSAGNAGNNWRLAQTAYKLSARRGVSIRG